MSLDPHWVRGHSSMPWKASSSLVGGMGVSVGGVDSVEESGVARGRDAASRAAGRNAEDGGAARKRKRSAETSRGAIDRS